MVHPTSVTNAIDRLEAGGLVRRVPDEVDRRRTLAELTDAGRDVVREATAALQDNDFFLDGSSVEDAERLYALLRRTRAAAGDFPDLPDSTAELGGRPATPPEASRTRWG